MNDLAIKIENVKKQYRLGTIGGGTLQGDLQSWWAKVRGKEDPNTKIGAKVYKKNEKFLALDGINLEVKKGEAIGIIGHNGAGKSTLLKLLSRVTAPTEGNICINGRISSMLEVGTGFHPELTGRENIYLNGAILGMSREEVTSKIDQIIEFSECGQFIDTPVKRYSSGMYVKLAFSVSAHLDSEILIMDEVLAVGDMKFQQKCIDKMRNVADEEGRTILYVSHNMNTIRKLCDRCIVLDHGKVIFEGDKEKAISIYLGKNGKALQSKEFEKDDHEKWCEQRLFIKNAVLQNDINSLYCGDILKYDINYETLMDMGNLHIRLVLLNDTGELVGMSMCEEGITLPKNSNGKLTVSFDTSQLAPGTYSTRISFFEIGEMGNHDYVGVINEFMVFDLYDNPAVHYNMNWNTRSWGYIAYKPIEIEVE